MFKITNLSECIEKLDEFSILKCLFKLSSSELDIYYLLRNRSFENPLTVNEIASMLNRSRSSIQKSLIKLLQLGLVSRRLVLVKNGGYTYVYYVKFRNDVKEKLLKLLDECYHKARSIIENL